MMNNLTKVPVNIVPIALAFTSNYVVPAATTVLSVLKNSKAQDKFHFICLLTDDLPAEIIKNLHDLAGEKALFSFINMTGRLGNIYIDEKYTIAASYRLLLADLVSEYDKILYMDCDFIVQNDVAKLYHDLDLDSHYMAGVFEAALPEQLAHLAEIGCLPGQYVNSGFLIMNLQQLRADNMVSKFIEASKNDTLEFPDQDVINILCKGRLLGLAPYWNGIRTFMLPQYKDVFLTYYSLQEWEDVQKRGNVHYTGPKPWNTFTVGFGAWWVYYRKLPRPLKAFYKISNRLRLLAGFYSTPMGKFAIDSVQNIYRDIKRKQHDRKT